MAYGYFENLPKTTSSDKVLNIGVNQKFAGCPFELAQWFINLLITSWILPLQINVLVLLLQVGLLKVKLFQNNNQQNYTYFKTTISRIITQANYSKIWKTKSIFMF